MLILGIESSCDETAAAIVGDGRDVRANVISSQIATHAGYGGVVPELAAREHLKAIDHVVTAALQESHLQPAAIDAVAVTNGPGLIPALLVGVSYAKGLALGLDRPFLGVNHFLAHLYGAFIEHPEQCADSASYPLLALVVSGGHTSLTLISADGFIRIIGATIDDAAGEAFDKAAKLLDLGYPGGPIIDRLAQGGNSGAVAFPHGLMARPGHIQDTANRFNFSFSGLKTALLYHVRNRSLTPTELRDVVASYQQAVVDVLVAKTMDAAHEFKVPLVLLCGGVACNRQLRRDLAAATDAAGRSLLLAPPCYCTDNAAMVAGLAYHYLKKGLTSSLNLGAVARLPAAPGTFPCAPGLKKY